MNSITGKSTGIALLMAAALIAALFAMGVFSATGVGADVNETPAPTVSLDPVDPEADVTITLNFRVDTAIDEEANEVVVTIPDEFELKEGLPEPTVNIQQNNSERGSSEFTAAAGGDDHSITIGTSDVAGGNILAGQLVTVEIVGFVNPEAANDIPGFSFAQGTQTAIDITSPAAPDVFAGLTARPIELSDDEPAATGVAMTLEFTPGEAADVEITLPEEYDLLDGGGTLPAGWAVTLNGAAPGTALSYTAATGDVGDIIEIPAANLTAGTAVKVVIGNDADVTPDQGFTNPAADTYEVSFQAGTGGGQTERTAVEAEIAVVTPPVELDATSSNEPGSGQSLMVKGFVNYTDADNITVNLNKFGVPSSIDDDQVVVSDGTNSANPSDIEIDGTKVTLVAPFEYTSGTDTLKLSSNGDSATEITFRRAAGITLPILHGDYDIKVSTSETPELAAAMEGEGMVGGDGVINNVSVMRQVKVSPTSGNRGTEITITAKGYTDNTHDVVMGSGSNSLTMSADATDGVLTLKVDTAIKNNDDNSVFQSEGATTITVGSASTSASATFTIEASFSWKPESPTPGQDITITLVDIDPENTGTAATVDPALDVAPTITIGGQVVQGVGNAGDDKRSTWKGQVHGDTPLGNRRIGVAVDGEALKVQNITVGTNELTVTPTTVVPRQTLSIDGDGFTPRGTVDLSKVSVDDVAVMSEAGTTQAINNNGNISFDISVPDTVSAGPATVKVVGSGDRIGTASITIAKAEITLSPTESLRGETITVSGTGFPAGDLVLIKYHEGTVDTASTSPTGTFEKDITVPARATINPGGKYEVEAVSQVNAVDVSATADHEIKDPEISMNPTSAVAGSSITISGSNFKGFLQVHSIAIGGQDVTPVPAPSTDVWGSFTASGIQVPQLDATRHAVKVVVGAADGSDGDATEFLTVVTETVEVLTDPADVFADLIADGSLTVVWHLDAATQVWTSYSTNPDLADFQTLTEIKGNQVYTLILTAAGEFNGTPLFPGTNQIFIP